MRIVLLAHNLRVAGGLSVGKNIVTTLPDIAPMHDYLIVVPAGCDYPEFEGQANVTMLVAPSMGLLKRARWERSVLRPQITQFQPDWIWGLGNLGLKNPPCKQAVLFHDTHLIYPESHFATESFVYKLKKRFLRFLLRRCLPKTDIVFCQTQTSRNRFAKVYNRDIDTIAVCPNAVSAFCQTDTISTPESLKPFDDRFKLFVLTKCYGHKNIQTILDTYNEFRDELKDTLCVLTIEANQHPIAPGLLQRIEDERLGNVILNVGPLDQTILSSYYHSCDALLLPTLLESFSGTYLEAMNFHVPILTSDLDFAHDVCGDAALYFDPHSTLAMRDAILQCKTDAALRDDLIRRGQDRLQSLFRSWDEILRDALDAMDIPHQ
ncbi:MAG: glycosyltransferase family 4 protein [Phycisphaerales bacterium]|jgi:glycosyltransferase involved in cell wall biosynthesis|nr:glycosyltransferase family 4 protein [Phycisphaerales bacterium]MBT7170450.1 glycosyltransferase family 4 protein [Phycisphaerales bacterium]